MSRALRYDAYTPTKTSDPAMKAKSYYSLLIKDSGKWMIHFGDYDREVVEDEQADVKGSEPKAKTKIIRTGGTQAEIDAAVDELNK